MKKAKTKVIDITLAGGLSFFGAKTERPNKT
jgi:hypothetical protein